jgi:hypothetical protein
LPSLSLLLVKSSLHSLSSLLLLLLLLLLLRAVLVLAPDGAAWVRAALVRDLVLRAPADPAAHLLAAGML